MSRLRIGHGPDDWKPEDPGTARTHSKAFSVPANTIPDMKPVMTIGGLPAMWRSEYKQKALRVKP